MCAEPADDARNPGDTAQPQDLARAALERVKQTAERRGATPRQRSNQPGTARVRPGDPEPVATGIANLLTERGWRGRATIATLFGCWADLVGAQVAEHCQPRSYEEGRLALSADSTAWATHLRALAPQLLRRLDEELGAGVVREVRITGPTSPSWRHGPRHVRGRGPRDTYG